MSKKKRTAKIAGIVLAPILLAAVIVAVFLPSDEGVSADCPWEGVDFSFPSAHFPLADFPWYDVSFAEETQTIEFEGIIAEIPAYFVENRRSAQFLIFADCPDDRQEIISIGAPFYTEFDLLEMVGEFAAEYGLSEEAAAMFFTVLGFEPPETMFDFMYLIFSITWDDFSSASPLSWTAFATFAALKDFLYESMPAEERYYYESEYFRGFIMFRRREDRGNYFVGDLSFVEDGNKSAIFIVNTESLETARAFFNSLRHG
jgi:hypothetical protein